MDTPQGKESSAAGLANDPTDSLCWACRAPLLATDANVCPSCERHQGRYVRHLPVVSSLVTILGVLLSISLVILAAMQYQQASKEHLKARDAVRIADESQKTIANTERQLLALKKETSASASMLKSLQRDYEAQLAGLRQERARLNADLARIQFGTTAALHRTMPKNESLDQLADNLMMKSLEEIEKADCALLSLEDGKKWNLGDDCSAERFRRESTDRQ